MPTYATWVLKWGLGFYPYWNAFPFTKFCRCRHGYFHVVNNDYSHWEMYAIGGSAAPTINSQGNRFLAPNDKDNKEVRTRSQYKIQPFLPAQTEIYTLKCGICEQWTIKLAFNVVFAQVFTFSHWFQVTKHENAPQREWKKWNWRSKGDLLLNGAFFTPSGTGASSSYAKASSLGARPSSLVSTITAEAGSLKCKKGSRCWYLMSGSA